MLGSLRFGLNNRLNEAQITFVGICFDHLFAEGISKTE
jgi:hypothetical protein